MNEVKMLRKTIIKVLFFALIVCLLVPALTLTVSAVGSVVADSEMVKSLYPQNSTADLTMSDAKGYKVVKNGETVTITGDTIKEQVSSGQRIIFAFEKVGDGKVTVNFDSKSSTSLKITFPNGCNTISPNKVNDNELKRQDNFFDYSTNFSGEISEYGCNAKTLWFYSTNSTADFTYQTTGYNETGVNYWASKDKSDKLNKDLDKSGNILYKNSIVLNTNDACAVMFIIPKNDTIQIESNFKVTCENSNTTLKYAIYKANPYHQLAYGFYSNPVGPDKSSNLYDTYTIDILTDQMPAGTYWQLGSNTMYATEETQKYYNAKEKFGIYFYSGLQTGSVKEITTDSGEKQLVGIIKDSDNSQVMETQNILSFWETKYIDASTGEEKKLKAQCLYPDAGKDFNHEGDGVSSITPFYWESNHWYRMVLKSWQDEATGNTFVAQWFQDRESGEWTLSRVYDTKMKNSSFKGVPSVFLENFSSTNKNFTRDVYLKNIYARYLQNDCWYSMNTSKLSYGDGGGWNKSGVHVLDKRNDPIDNSECFYGQTGGEATKGDQAVFEASSKKEETITISQPAQPSFGAQKNLQNFTVSKKSNTLYVSWAIDNTSTPQLSYKVEVYNQLGQVVKSKYETRPDITACSFGGFVETEYKCVLTVNDIFGNTKTETYQTSGYGSKRVFAYGNGMSNWLDSPNNAAGSGIAPGVTQISFVPTPWDSSYYKKGLSVTVRMKATDGSSDDTFTATVASVNDGGTWGVCRIEPCLMSNPWIPAKNKTYIATFTYTDNKGYKVSETVDTKYYLNTDPVLKPTISVASNPGKTLYNMGECFNANGLTLNINNSNGSKSSVIIANNTAKYSNFKALMYINGSVVTLKNNDTVPVISYTGATSTAQITGTVKLHNINKFAQNVNGVPGVYKIYRTKDTPAVYKITDVDGKTVVDGLSVNDVGIYYSIGYARNSYIQVVLEADKAEYSSYSVALFANNNVVPVNNGDTITVASYTGKTTVADVTGTIKLHNVNKFAENVNGVLGKYKIYRNKETPSSFKIIDTSGKVIAEGLSAQDIGVYYSIGYARESYIWVCLLSSSTVTCTGFNSTSVGDKTVTVKAGGSTATFAASVFEPTITAKPDKTSFVEATKVKLTTTTPEFCATVSWKSSDTSVVTVKNENGNYYAYGVKPGTATITSSFILNGKTYSSSVKLTVNAKQVSAVSIKQLPKRLAYRINDNIDTSGLILKVNYDNGTTTDITSGYTTSGFRSDFVGTKTISVNYGGKSATYDITVYKIVVAVKNVSLIEGKQTRLTYTITPNLNAKVSIKSSNASVASIDDEALGYYYVKAVKPGTATITASFTLEGIEYSSSVNVTVNAKTVTNIGILQLPNKTTYKGGEALNTNGLTLKVNYNNGTTENVTSGFTTSGFSSNTLGTKTVNVSYGGRTTSFNVTVSDPTWTEVTPYTVGSNVGIDNCIGVKGKKVTEIKFCLSNWDENTYKPGKIVSVTMTSKEGYAYSFNAKITNVYNGKTWGICSIEPLTYAYVDTLAFCPHKGEEYTATFTFTNQYGRQITVTSEQKFVLNDNPIVEGVNT